MRKIKVAIIGGGNVANGMHIPAWKKIPEAEVVAVCDINVENAERTAKKWRIPKVYSDFDELLEKEDVTVLDICTPPATHAPLSVKAMEAGFNVLLEKPMAMSVGECEKILKEYQKRRDEVKFCVVHNYLFSPPVLEIKSIIMKKCKRLLGAEICIFGTKNDEMVLKEEGWWHRLPGGIFGESLIHPVYMLQNLIGKIKVRDVFVAKTLEYPWIKYDELSVTFSSDNKFGSILCSFNSPIAVDTPTIRVYSSEVIVNYDGSNSTIFIQETPRRRKLEKFIDSLLISSQIVNSSVKNAFKVLTGRWKSGHEYLFRLFVYSILEDKKMPYTSEEAFEATKVFLEVLERLP